MIINTPEDVRRLQSLLTAFTAIEQLRNKRPERFKGVDANDFQLASFLADIENQESRYGQFKGGSGTGPTNVMQYHTETFPTLSREEGMIRGLSDILKYGNSQKGDMTDLGMANTWKDVYNTSAGAGTPEEFIRTNFGKKLMGIL